LQPSRPMWCAPTWYNKNIGWAPDLYTVSGHQESYPDIYAKSFSTTEFKCLTLFDLQVTVPDLRTMKPSALNVCWVKQKVDRIHYTHRMRHRPRSVKTMYIVNMMAPTMVIAYSCFVERGRDWDSFCHGNYGLMKIYVE